MASAASTAFAFFMANINTDGGEEYVRRGNVYPQSRVLCWRRSHTGYHQGFLSSCLGMPPVYKVSMSLATFLVAR
jgi:hypothetical protein